MLALLAALGLLGTLSGEVSNRAPARNATQATAGKSGLDLYVAEPGESPGSDTEHQLTLDKYWQTRVTYPTGKFNPKWLADAARQDSLNVGRGVPAGRVTYSPRNAPSLVTLDPNAWTNLGPAPLESDTCQACFTYGRVAGRVNDIVVDPANTSIAFLAADGGGVWKTTNCCSAATLWSPVTDNPLISSVAIGDLSIDANNHNVYAGTGDLTFGSFSFGSAGVLKSTDQGATWTIKGADVFGPYYPEPADKFPQYNSISKVEPDPRNSNNLVVGTKLGAYFSYNGGDNWAGPCVPDIFSSQRQDITSIIMHPNNTNTATDLYVAVGTRGYSTTVQYNLAENGANGIYKTTVPLAGCPAAWTLVSRPDNGWPVGTGSGAPVYQALGNPVGRIDMAMAPSNPNVIYAQVQAIVPGLYGATMRGGQLGLWRTTDGGLTWQQRSSGSTLDQDGDTCGPLCAVSPTLCGDYPQNWYDQGIAVDPNSPDTIYMDTYDIWKSTDGGASFTDTTCGYGYLGAPNPNGVHVDQHALTFVGGSSSTLLAGSDGGAYVSLNANLPQPTFNQVNNTLRTIELYSGDITANFATSPAQMASGGAQDNGSSVWDGDPTYLWKTRLGGDGFFARIEPVQNQRWFFESQNGNLNVSTTGPYGALTSAKGGWAADTLSFIFPYEMYKNDCPSTCDHMIAGSNRVWESITGGTTPASWYANSPNLTKGTLDDRSFINQLAFAVPLSSTVIVGTNDGNVQYGFNMGQGTPDSATWVNVTGGNAVLPNRPILDVATDALNPLVGYAAIGGFTENTPSTPGHLYQVTCTASCASFTWVNKSGNLPNIPADSVIVNPRFRKQVFVGTDWGVYYTNDIDVTNPVWFRFNNGMPNVMVWDLMVDQGNTTLAAFTRSRGLFVWPLPDAPFSGTPQPTATGTPPTTTPSITPQNTPSPTNTFPPTATFTPTPTVTPLGCGASMPVNEGFESGTLGVMTATTTLGSEVWAPSQAHANTGSYAAYAIDPDEPSDQSMVMQNFVAIPAGATEAYVHFAHTFSFEQPDFDGGVVEYSTNGAVWLDAGPLMTEGGYNGTLGASSGNPLSGRAAYVNQKPGFPAFSGVTVNLISLAGQQVKLRWRLGSDLNGTSFGWWVDDIYMVIVQPCAATFTPTATATVGSPTATPVGVSYLVGHVDWQGRTPGTAVYQIPITLTLKSGLAETNYPPQNTDANGYFTVTVNMPPGQYQYRVKDPKYLANSGSVNIALGANSKEMGTLRAGDANDDNLVDSQDFNILKNTFGKTVGDPGYDDRADFNGDQLVDSVDFNLLKTNFGSPGAPGVRPGSPGAALPKRDPTMAAIEAYHNSKR